MANRLEGKKVAFLLTDGVEQVELTEPWKTVKDEGGTPELISLETGEIQGFNHPTRRTRSRRPVVGEADQTDFDGLVLPGGVDNPDILRMDEGRREVRALLLRGRQARRGDLPRPLDAGRGRRGRGRTLTSWPSIQTDIAQCGRQLGRRGGPRGRGLVTSRNPDDLPAFCDKLAEEICEGRHEEQAAQTA